MSQITSALKSASGVTPALDCDGSSISQIYWYFNLKGSVIDGEFVAIGGSWFGSLAWVVTTGAILVGLPYALASEEEAMYVRQEREFAQQQSGAQVSAKRERAEREVRWMTD